MGGGRSPLRNAPALLGEMQRRNVREGLVKISSGAGLLSAPIAPHFPDRIWHTSDIAPEKTLSIRALPAAGQNHRNARQHSVENG